MLWCPKLRHCVPQLVCCPRGGCRDCTWDGCSSETHVGRGHDSWHRKHMPVLQAKFPTPAYSPKLVELDFSHLREEDREFSALRAMGLGQQRSVSTATTGC